MERPQSLLSPITAFVLLVLRHLHTCPLGKGTYRIGVAQPLNFHNEIDSAAALMAAEAVIDTLIGRNGKGGGFLPVEGAQTKQIGAGPF